MQILRGSRQLMVILLLAVAGSAVAQPNLPPTESQKQVFGYNAVYNMWMNKGNSERAKMALRGMFMALSAVEYAQGKAVADATFIAATGMRDRSSFFRMLEITDHFGALAKEPRRRSLRCHRDVDDVVCSE